jgi:hypothetical protein
VQDAADYTAIIHSILATYIRRQKQRDPTPLLVAQPKQIASHLLCSLTAENQQLILTSTYLLGFDPSHCRRKPAQ